MLLPHTLHVVHAPPLMNLFAVQLAQSVALGPEHVAQPALHAAHVVSAIVVHADT